MFKPMLCPQKDPMSHLTFFKELEYPLLCSPKYDGIRCIIKNGIAMSRKFLALPSLQVQTEFGIAELEHCDGELIEGQPNDPGVYNRTQSHVMSEDKPGDIRFYIFDYTHPTYLNKPFYERLEKINLVNPVMMTNAMLVEQVEVNTEEELLRYESKILQIGFEGIIMKSPVGYYKQGRGTMKEGIIYKLKRFKDDEALIVGFEEGMANNNEQKRDALGYAERSSSKDGLIAAGTLGKFIVSFQGQEITIAPGAFDHVSRKQIWDNQSNYIGKVLKFRHFAHGVKDRPRFPRAIGFRNLMDM